MTITTPITLPEHHPFTGRNVASVLAERSGRFVGREFLTWEPFDGDGESWTYDEFAAQVDRAAAGLLKRGVGRGDAVMLLLENSPGFLISWFACARIGAVAVDTNIRYAPDEIDHAVSLTDPVGIITHEHLLERLGANRNGRWVALVDEPTGLVSDLDADPAGLPDVGSIDPNDPLCIQFTSGTTSRPKAALYTHANALWAGYVGVAHGRVSPDDVALVYAPLFHTMALFWQTMPTFWAGGRVVLVPRYSASRFWDVSVRNGCTRTFFQEIVAATAPEVIPENSYRVFISGAEMPAVEERFGVRIQTCWGMTEVVTNVIAGDLDIPGTPGSIGRVSPEYGLSIVDIPDSSGDPDEGELRIHGIRGLSLFAGYHNNPEATAEGFDDEGRWCTGDLVRRLPSGEIRFVSRAKDMLRVGGENVAAAEIERVMMIQPEVTGAAVVGIPDPVRGEIPVGFVVASVEDTDDLASRVVADCSSKLADFKVPRRVYVIDEMPESLIGKTSKKLLRERAIALSSD